jgi:hypothetical protein
VKVYSLSMSVGGVSTIASVEDVHDMSHWKLSDPAITRTVNENVATVKSGSYAKNAFTVKS